MPRKVDELVTPEVLADVRELDQSVRTVIKEAVRPIVESYRAKGWLIQVDYTLAVTPPALTEPCPDCGMPHPKRELVEALAADREHVLNSILNDLPTMPEFPDISRHN